MAWPRLPVYPLPACGGERGGGTVLTETYARLNADIRGATRRPLVRMPPSPTYVFGDLGWRKRHQVRLAAADAVTRTHARHLPALAAARRSSPRAYQSACALVARAFPDEYRAALKRAVVAVAPC